VKMAQATLYVGTVDGNPLQGDPVQGDPEARDPDLEFGLRQRARLFETILSDLLGDNAIGCLGLIPEPLLRHYPALRLAGQLGTPPLRRYAADLVQAPDRGWRVRADRTCAPANHPMAKLFEAPALAPFLPALCRALLRETLRLPSVSTLWLHDAASRTQWAAEPRKWLLHDGLRQPTSFHAPDSLADRRDWQRRLETTPWALAATHAWCWRIGRADRSLHATLLGPRPAPECPSLSSATGRTLGRTTGRTHIAKRVGYNSTSTIAARSRPANEIDEGP